MRHSIKYEGDLAIKTAADAKEYRDLTEVTGYLYIYWEARLDALASVGGDLFINSVAKLDALTSVGGYLHIYWEAKVAAPKLESVGGHLYIHSEPKLGALASVGGDLHIHSEAKLAALASVGGDLYIHSEVKLDALSAAGNLFPRSEARLDSPKLYPKGFDSFKVYDDIACAVLSTKKKGDIELLSCRHAKIKRQKLIGEKFFVARRGNNSAHAEDLKTALEDLAYKFSDRGVEQYENMPKDTRKSPEEWAFVYRKITGACRFGTDRFIQSKGKIKETYTLAEILTETNGAYGHDVFRRVVAG